MRYDIRAKVRTYKDPKTGEDKESWNSFYRKQMQMVKARILEEVHKYIK